MEIAALILSVISLIISVLCVSFMLAKNFFSTHTVQYVDPFKDQFPKEMGKAKFNEYQDIELPLDQEEIDELKGKKIKF